MTTITITDLKEHSRLKRALDELESISLADFRELLAISDLIVQGTATAPSSVLADMPVFLPGGVKIYQPSIGALEFVNEYAEQWFGDHPIDGDIFTTLVFSLSRKPQRLALLNCRDAAKRAVDRLKLRLGLTHAELKIVNAHALTGFPVTAQGADKGHEAALLSACAGLAKQQGDTIESWLWDRSAQKVVWLIREKSDDQATNVKPTKINAISKFKQTLKRIKGE